MSDPIRRLFDFAESCVFSKQSPEPFHCDPLLPQGAKPPGYSGAPLLPKLRGHFAEFLKQDSLEHLRILSLPTCVGLRYGHPKSSHRGFSWRRDYGQFVSLRTPHRLSELTAARICLGNPPTGLDPHFQSRAGLSPPRHPLASLSSPRWYRNIDLFAIAYAFRPRLRTRLTLSGLTFLRKP